MSELPSDSWAGERRELAVLDLAQEREAGCGLERREAVRGSGRGER